MNVGESLRDHASDKLSHITEKFFAAPLEAHVVFDKSGHEFKADIHIHVGRGINAHGQAAANDAYAAFDQALDRVETRLRRYKEKLKNSHGPSKSEVIELVAQQYVLAGDAHEDIKEEAPDQPLVIAEMQTKIDTLAVSEAVMRLDLSGSPVIVFKNRKDGNVNVIYRRPDGNYGWIDPSSNNQIKAAE
jgi:ribosomal subunit interface protein